MRSRFVSFCAAAVLATAALAGTTGTALMATQTSFTIAPRTYQIGTTATSRAIPAGDYSGFHITADFSPWTSPATTDVQIGISVSYDGGATYEEVCATGEVTPAPWIIPAKYGGGSTSIVGPMDCTWGTSGRPTNAQGWVTVQGHSVALGQITVTLE